MAMAELRRRRTTKLYLNSQHVNDTIDKYSVFLVGYYEDIRRQIIVRMRYHPYNTK